MSRVPCQQGARTTLPHDTMPSPAASGRLHPEMSGAVGPKHHGTMAGPDSVRARPRRPSSGWAAHGGMRPFLPGPAGQATEDVLSLDEQFAYIVGMLDRVEVLRRMVARVPDVAGLDLAWLGDLGGPDEIVLQH